MQIFLYKQIQQVLFTHTHLPTSQLPTYPHFLVHTALDNVSGIEREIDDDDEEEEEEVAVAPVKNTVVPTSQRSNANKLSQLFTLGELSASSPDGTKALAVDIALEDNRNGTHSLIPTIRRH